MKDLTDLRKIAEEATPGPWEPYDANEGMDRAYSPMWCVANEEFHNPTTGDDEDWMGVEIHVGDKADSDHIATFDPPTVLALITRLEQAERDLVVVRESQKKIAKQFAAMGTEKGKAEWRAREAEQAVARVRELALESQAEVAQMNMPNIRTLSGEILRALDGEPNE